MHENGGHMSMISVHTCKLGQNASWTFTTVCYVCQGGARRFLLPFSTLCNPGGAQPETPHALHCTCVGRVWRFLTPLSTLAIQAEHSLELHTPYIARVMAGRPFKLVPIVVGALSVERCGKGVLSPPAPTHLQAHIQVGITSHIHIQKQNQDLPVWMP